MADNIMLEIAKWLADQGAGTFHLDTNTGWGIYVINQPSGIDKVVLLTPTPAASDADIPTTRKSFQVMAVAKKTSDAYAKAKEVHDLMARQIAVQLETIYVFSFTATTSPYYLSRDDDKRARVVANYVAFARGNNV